MKRVVLWAAPVAVTIAAVPRAGAAQTAAPAPTVTPIPAVPQPPAAMMLPRNTPVYLTLNETLSTRSSAVKAGSPFALTVSHSVTLGRYVVIPRGSRAVGTVVWRTRKGAFGKSGKIDVSLDYIEVGDQRIAIEGHHREEGEGNSTATVATFVFLSMLGSGLITGHSAEIPAGHEFTAWTKDEVPVQLPEVAADRPALAGAIVAQPMPGTHPAAPLPTRAVPPALGGHVICVTCR